MTYMDGDPGAPEVQGWWPVCIAGSTTTTVIWNASWA